MQERNKIPATVITGFLGAGKTSLIRHILQTAKGRRIALVINEFGDLGVDRELLAGCGIAGCASDDIIELTNGCICCTVADDFLPTIEALLARDPRPDHIVIETSGLALPKPLVKAFSWPSVRTRVTVDGVIAVIDAEAVADGRFAADPDAVAAQRGADPALDHDSPLVEVFEDQLSCADLVVLNKVDLLDSSGLARVQEVVRTRLNPAVKVVSTKHGAVDPGVLLGLDAAVEDDIALRPSHHDEVGGNHDHDDFESFTIEFGPVVGTEALQRRVAAVVETYGVLRVKGFVEIVGKRMRRVVQAVGTRVDAYYDRPWGDGEARRSRLMVIGEKGLDRAAVAAALEA